MDLKDEIIDLKEKLISNGYKDDAELLDLCINRNDVVRIGVVGDYSTGKSTLINVLLNQKILKPSVIPTDTQITIKNGKINGIIANEGELLQLDSLENLLEDKTQIEISCSSEILKNKEIIEFPGLISKKSLNNLQTMKNLYLCDGAIIVISAEHMLSETECAFIKNYAEYVDEKRLFVVINKLDMIESHDIVRIADYAANKMKLLFPNVKWCFLQNELLPKNYDNKLGRDYLVNVVNGWCNEEPKSINENAYINVKNYIKEKLTEDMKKLKAQSELDSAQKKAEAERLLKEKELSKIRLENIGLEFEGKYAKSIDDLDDYIKDIFDKLERSILHKFDAADDKYKWYKDNLPMVWDKDIKIVASKADEYILTRVGQDVEWLKEKSTMSTDADLNIPDVFYRQLENNYQGKSYNKFKKYIPIGIGGSVAVGFCLFRIVGASVCLGGGMLFEYYVNYAEQAQSKELKDNISSDINKVARESRLLVRKEIKTIYEGVVSKYNNGIDDYLDKKYDISFSYDNLTVRIKKIEQTIGLL
jgi:GTP-binding protein EngB required for normal cell division